MASVKLSFAEPTHGWLPVTLSIDGAKVEFLASDVPNNPVEELIDALHSAHGNREATVWWHLEPGGYYFEFTPVDGEVQLRVLFTEDSRRGERNEVLALRGKREEVLLPLWRGLRQLQSFGVAEPHWPEVRYDTLEKLGEQLHAGRS